MTQIKIFTNTYFESLEEEVNEYIKDKEVVNINSNIVINSHGYMLFSQTIIYKVVDNN